MPIIYQNRTSQTCGQVVGRINESEENLIAQSSPHDKEWIVSLASLHPKKRLESLATRVIIKMLMEDFDLDYQGIYKDEWGKPHLKGHNIHLSIAHSFPMVSAIIDLEKPTGIDLEKPRPKLNRVRKKFLNPEEQVHAGEDLDRLCLYWCAKETLYKLHGRKRLSFRHHLNIAPFINTNSGNLSGSIILDNDRETHQLRYFYLEEYFIVFCC